VSKEINRRDALKASGAAIIATTGLSNLTLASTSPKEKPDSDFYKGFLERIKNHKPCSVNERLIDHCMLMLGAPVFKMPPVVQQIIHESIFDTICDFSHRAYSKIELSIEDKKLIGDYRDTKAETIGDFVIFGYFGAVGIEQTEFYSSEIMQAILSDIGCLALVNAEIEILKSKNRKGIKEYLNYASFFNLDLKYKMQMKEVITKSIECNYSKDKIFTATGYGYFLV
jgi:hypothetical protein